MSEFQAAVAELRQQWVRTRADSGLTFQEFLLVNILLHIQETNANG